ncbi:hypothetical protein V1478_016609 [Vespula squamosa]|uniref:Uncharacterized protein n=1 Tax=Vespula squamosa TaxID=30214 RepID=A0ABD2A0X4_VESSQ
MLSIKRRRIVLFEPRPSLILGFYKERHAHFPRAHEKSTIEEGRTIRPLGESFERRSSRGTRSPSKRRSLPYNFTVKPFLFLDPDEPKSLVFGLTAVYPKYGLMLEPRNEADARSKANAQT